MSLSCGYIPVIGDQVVAEIIESEQKKCSWRALKVLPEVVSKKLQNKANSNREKLEESHPGLEISNCQLSLDKLGESKQFTVTLTNNSSEIFKLLTVKLSENCSQLVLERIPQQESILPSNSLSINLVCTAKTMGTSNEFLEFCFEGFTIGKYINITVNSNKSGGYYQKNHLTNYNNSYTGDKQVIRFVKQ